jgi:hypothetical protein
MFREGGSTMRARAGIVYLLSSLLFNPAALRCQQPPPPTSTNGQNPNEDRTSQEQSTEVEAVPGDPPPLVSIDSGQAVNHGVSSIHWGKLSLFSLNILGIRDDVSVGSVNQTLTTGVIKGFLLYSFKHGRDEFDFQYLPQVIISSYGTNSNFGNQALQFHTFRHLANRWSLNFSDTFSYQPNQGYIQDATIIPQFPTGAVLQNPFLTPNQGFLNNLVQATFTYNRSQKNGFNYSVRYGFLRVTSSSVGTSPPVANGNVNGNDHLVGGGMEWQHNWNPVTSFGLGGNYDRRFLSGGGSADYYSLLASYRRRLTHTIFFSGSIGPTFLRETDVASSGSRTYHTLTYEGSVTLTKAFQRSGLAFSFDRNHISSQYLQGTLTDRWGVSYSRFFGLRWTSLVGAGYLRQQFTANAGNSAYDGRAAWAQAGYALFREWSVTGSYTRFTDTGLLGQAAQTRNLFVAGLRWAWAPHDRSGPMPRPPGRTGGPGD